MIFLVIFSSLFLLSNSVFVDFTLNCKVVDENENCEIYCKIPGEFEENDELRVQKIELKDVEMAGNSSCGLSFDSSSIKKTIPQDIGSAFRDLRWV